MTIGELIQKLLLYDTDTYLGDEWYDMSLRFLLEGLEAEEAEHKEDHNTS